MKNLTKLSALLAVAAIAPAVVAPTLVSSAHAQDKAEFQDVPTTHWAYAALQKLAAAGILEGYPPTGNFIGQRPMTRYEFAVAIARLLDRLPPATQPYDDTALKARIAALEAKPDYVLPADVVHTQQLNDAITALQREFHDELSRLDGRLTTVENRVTNLENKVTPPPRFTTSLAVNHTTGVASYINNGAGGRQFLNGNTVSGNPNGILGLDGTANDTSPHLGNFFKDASEKKFSYTDFEVRMTDKVSDRLSVNAALRSLGANQEDPWAGESGGGLYVREAYATANLADKSFLGFKNINATLGRQHTKIASGLLYDNQLSPTDQIRTDSTFGPFSLTSFVGTMNNTAIGVTNGFGGSIDDPYSNQGAVHFLNTGNANLNGQTGFANGLGASPADDNESLVHASVNLFKISGQPVQLGATKLFDGYQFQEGEGADLTLPLFNRTIGVELVRQNQGANGAGTGHASAGIVTVPILRSGIIDLNFAYGKAGDNFEYYAASSANPYARTYAEAIFDRPIALGAPLLNGGNAGAAQAVAAKETYDVTGTLRIPFSFLRRIPLDFRYYKAKSGGDTPSGDNEDLGHVVTIGTRISVTPGVDLEVKGGRYSPSGNVADIQYVRIGASVGF